MTLGGHGSKWVDRTLVHPGVDEAGTVVRSGDVYSGRLTMILRTWGTLDNREDVLEGPPFRFDMAEGVEGVQGSGLIGVDHT